MKYTESVIYSLLSEIELDSYIPKAVRYSLNETARHNIGEDTVFEYEVRVYENGKYHILFDIFHQRMEKIKEPYAVRSPLDVFTYGLYTNTGEYLKGYQEDADLKVLWGQQTYIRDNHKILRLIGAIP